jgi:hypothetical protein
MIAGNMQIITKAQRPEGTGRKVLYESFCLGALLATSSFSGNICNNGSILVIRTGKHFALIKPH